MMSAPLTLSFDRIGIADIPKIGGKNVSLGEMVQALARVGVRVPDGFATTADAYRLFLEKMVSVNRYARHRIDIEQAHWHCTKPATKSVA
jgi:phosphoenolpyruvate synthase/pyruvate phosphate dikinase